MRKKKKTQKTGQHGFFQWQTLLVASAFLGFFVFAGYICGNISTPYRIPDTNSEAYQQSETAFLIFFIVGSVVSLLLALFSAYMCDHPTLLKDKFRKLFRRSAETTEVEAQADLKETVSVAVACDAVTDGTEGKDTVREAQSREETAEKEHII